MVRYNICAVDYGSDIMSIRKIGQRLKPKDSRPSDDAAAFYASPDPVTDDGAKPEPDEPKSGGADRTS